MRWCWSLALALSMGLSVTRIDPVLGAEPVAPGAATGAATIVPSVTIPRSSPVEYFRRLLGMTPEEREGVLADRKPEQRAVLLAKLDEYARMSEKERELRLRLLQVRLYVLPLLQVPLAKREELLAQVPVSEQALVRDRLQAWDRLSAAQREQILGDPTRLHYFLYRPPGSGRLDPASLARITPQDRSREMEEALRRWRGMSESERQEVVARLGNFPRLDSKQRQLVLKRVPEPDRRPVEEVLLRFAALPSEQRAGVVAGIDRLAGLGPEERGRFMVQAERWSRMTAEERNMWREVMSRRPQAPMPIGAQPKP